MLDRRHSRRTPSFPQDYCKKIFRGFVRLNCLCKHAREGRPTVWIELGGQLERLDTAQTVFTPAFFSQAASDVLTPMINAQRPSRYSIGGEGRIIVAPEGSDWNFSASVRYGRSNATRHLHYQSDHPFTQTQFGSVVTENARPLNRFGDGQTQFNESHLVLDFLAGKDVGLGFFGVKGTSVLSAGVRFAQFTSSADIVLHARPLYQSGPILSNPGHYRFIAAHFHQNTATLQSRRNAYGIGPAVSWDASLPVASGNSSTGLSFDWGVNAAVLFGRQKARVRHQTTGAYLYDYPASTSPVILSHYQRGPYDRNRARTVTIPNVGGFAAVSARYLDAKVSFGYRADIFFGAVDNGIDAEKKQNVGFYGPFATISIGLGG